MNPHKDKENRVDKVVKQLVKAALSLSNDRSWLVEIDEKEVRLLILYNHRDTQEVEDHISFGIEHLFPKEVVNLHRDLLEKRWQVNVTEDGDYYMKSYRSAKMEIQKALLVKCTQG